MPRTYSEEVQALRARQRRDYRKASMLARNFNIRAAAGYLRNQGYSLTYALAWLRQHSAAPTVK